MHRSLVFILALTAGCGKANESFPPPTRPGPAKEIKEEGCVFRVPEEWKLDRAKDVTSCTSTDGMEQVTPGTIQIKLGHESDFDSVFRRLLEHRMTAMRQVGKSVTIDPTAESNESRGRVARFTGRAEGRRFAFIQLGQGRTIAYLYYESLSDAWRAEEILGSFKVVPPPEGEGPKE